MRVIVTGGAGFIGSHLSEALVARGSAVVCIDDLSSGRRENAEPALATDRAELRVADAKDPSAWGINGPVDRVYHLASPASPPHFRAAPVGTLRVCFEATLRALEFAEAKGARFVLASSSEIYGEPEEHPQREETRGRVDPAGPRACYQEGKRAAEALAASFAREGRADVRVARIFNTYGPRMRPDDGRAISNFLDLARRGAPLCIHGDGRQTRSFCYIRDLVTGLLALGESPDCGSEPINLGSDEEISIRELAGRVIDLTNSESELDFRPAAPGDPTRRKPALGRAQERLGYAPTVDLEEGLRRTLAPPSGARPDGGGAR